MLKTISLVGSALVSLSLVACSAADNTAVNTTGTSNLTGTGAADAGPAASTPMPDSLHWFRDSAEFQASARQAYILATAVLTAKTQQRDDSAKPWAVIVDGDETIFDNSQFEKESWQQGLAWSPQRWSEWVQRRAAGAIPGSVAFTHKVHELGGKLIVVTNRAAGADCDASEDNMKTLGLEYDAIFCQQGTVSDKNPRFQAIQDGSASTDLPALDVLMWCGDNILDFPAQSQAIRTGGDDAFADFGSRFIAIPNPLYGSWQSNPAD